jgi:hypothetical protein
MAGAAPVDRHRTQKIDMRNATQIFLLMVATLAAYGREVETLEHLKARVEAAGGDEKIKICLEIAEQQVEAANKDFNDGNVEAAHAAVDEVAVYAEKARDAAIASGRRLKDCEISARKMSRRLSDIKRTVAFEDQPVIEKAVRRLEDVRTDLLAQMFSKDKKKK